MHMQRYIFYIFRTFLQKNNLFYIFKLHLASYILKKSNRKFLKKRGLYLDNFKLFKGAQILDQSIITIHEQPNISVVLGKLSVGHPNISVVSGILSVVGIPPVPIPILEKIQLLMYDYHTDIYTFYESRIAF